jgi:hypothetical protein
MPSEFSQHLISQMNPLTLFLFSFLLEGFLLPVTYTLFFLFRHFAFLLINKTLSHAVNSRHFWVQLHLVLQVNPIKATSEKFKVLNG